VTDEYGIARKFKDARFQLIAPISNNMILSYIATKALGMPKSY
jgi:acyl-CoA dehydrogenase